MGLTYIWGKIKVRTITPANPNYAESLFISFDKPSFSPFGFADLIVIVKDLT